MTSCIKGSTVKSFAVDAGAEGGLACLGSSFSKGVWCVVCDVCCVMFVV